MSSGRSCRLWWIRCGSTDPTSHIPTALQDGHHFSMPRLRLPRASGLRSSVARGRAQPPLCALTSNSAKEFNNGRDVKTWSGQVCECRGSIRSKGPEFNFREIDALLGTMVTCVMGHFWGRFVPAVWCKVPWGNFCTQRPKSEWPIDRGGRLGERRLLSRVDPEFHLIRRLGTFKR